MRPAGSGPQMPDGQKPSEAFAPQNQGKSEADSTVPRNNDEGAEAATGGQTVSLVGRVRLVKQDFVAEGQGELGLLQGESVRVTHDPEGESGGGDDRWVYGNSED